MLRGEQEIQQAHDILTGLLLGEAREVMEALDEDDQGIVAAMASVLCWVLRHDHNESFAIFLRKLEELTQALGYRVVHRPPTTPQPPR